MKFIPMSDLHLEFRQKGYGISFVNKFHNPGVDALVLAGDIDTRLDYLVRTMKILCDKFPTVAMCLGNHEHYANNKGVVEGTMQYIEDTTSNFVWLRRGRKVTIEGVDVIGCTIWFKDDPMNMLYEKEMTDFHVIPDFRKWVYVEAEKDEEYLKRECTDGCVVVTHHAPHSLSVPPHFHGSPMNRFYVHDMTSLLSDGRVAMWVHGHMHNSIRYPAGASSTVVANPLGYYPAALNPGFTRVKIEEVLPKAKAGTSEETQTRGQDDSN